MDLLWSEEYYIKQSLKNVLFSIWVYAKSLINLASTTHPELFVPSSTEFLAGECTYVAFAASAAMIYFNYSQGYLLWTVLGWK
jgi:hypothetical protein